VLLKVSIFNAVLLADPGLESQTSIRGFFICAASGRALQNQLQDALSKFGLRLEAVEQEREIPEERLLECLPHVHSMYRTRGYGLEFYCNERKAKEGQSRASHLGRSTVSLSIPQPMHK
jgi:hypothetical protein